MHDVDREEVSRRPARPASPRTGEHERGLRREPPTERREQESDESRRPRDPNASVPSEAETAWWVERGEGMPPSRRWGEETEDRTWNPG